ncbi:hypothetical protein [Pontibacter pudoricolor]|nr:hypothetical protein [Pontibacter pudoricolor]
MITCKTEEPAIVVAGSSVLIVAKCREGFRGVPPLYPISIKSGNYKL